jgi:hypothetical protein
LKKSNQIGIKGEITMPCDSIITVDLELKNANLALLTKAINKIGQNAYIQLRDNGLVWNGGSYDKKTGILSVQNEADGKLIKRAYSGEIVKSQASRFGWNIKETSQFKYEIIKR